MASSQQPKTVQDQTVTVGCKAYPEKTLGIKDDGSVELLPSAQQWEKVGVDVKPEVIDGVEVQVEVFLLLNKDKTQALAHQEAGQKVYLADYDKSVPPKTNVLWGRIPISGNEFKPIYSARDSKDVGTNIYVSLDVKQSGESTDVVVNPPNKADSQLWQMSPFN